MLSRTFVDRKMSRIDQDLSTSPHQYSSFEKGHRPGMLSRVLSRGRKPHVCVVGAGVAGLRCSETLLQHGVQVTLLEGRDRIGGRVSYPRVMRRTKLKAS